MGGNRAGDFQREGGKPSGGRVRSIRGERPPSGADRRGPATGITRRAWIPIHSGFFAYMRVRAKHLYQGGCTCCLAQPGGTGSGAEVERRGQGRCVAGPEASNAASRTTAGLQAPTQHSCHSRRLAAAEGTGRRGTRAGAWRGRPRLQLSCGRPGAGLQGARRLKPWSSSRFRWSCRPAGGSRPRHLSGPPSPT